MKKTLLIYIITVLLGTTAFCQEIEIGLKGGMNFTNLGSSDLGLQSRIGYHLGGYEVAEALYESTICGDR